MLMASGAARAARLVLKIPILSPPAIWN